MTHKVFVQSAILVGLLLVLIRMPFAASRSSGKIVTASEAYPRRDSSYSSADKRTPALRPSLSGRQTFPWTIVQGPGMRPQTTLARLTKIPTDGINPQQPTTDLIPHPSYPRKDSKSEPFLSKRVSLRTMVIAGTLISAKVVIDNYSSFSGSSALTKKVQTFFLQICA